MKDNGLDFRTGRDLFRKEVVALSGNVKEQIRVKSGTKLDLFNLAISNEKIGNFLGVTEKMKILGKEWFEKDFERDKDSKQFGSGEIVKNQIRYSTFGGHAYQLDDFMKALGYQDLVGSGTGLGPYDKTWKFGFAEEE
jgi:hypothetical protein